ncbi:putative leucine-rich repeat domain superfamily [Plasmopara halstedii]
MATGSVTLTIDVVMDRAGVYDVLALKELILRDETLVDVDETCAQNLASLEILSLSHNQLTSLQHFQYLVNLIELNVNFNQIKTLDNLECAGLEKLFIANNQIVNISPLRKLLKLNTLSVYGNQIIDLDAALHTCRSLPKLRSLDLGGNLCSCNVNGYKFRVVRALSRLEILDGDHLTQLDKDLTENFFAFLHKKTVEDNNWQTRARPVTAPAGKRYPVTSISNDADPFASHLMPRGNVRLFRDDFFNNSPILLEYLSQDAGVSPASTYQLQSEDVDNHELSSNFVDKMRSANPLSKSDMELTEADTLDSTLTAKITLSPNILTSHLDIDPSDPNTTIRKLLKHIEVLMETLTKYKNCQLKTVNDSLLEEIKQLQIENNNIPILQEQIQDLKKQVANLKSHSDDRGMDEAKSFKSMKQQNASLKQENARLRQLLGRTKEMEESDEPTRCSKDTVIPKRLSHSKLLDESALIDVELTELILQNEISLELIRNDIIKTKKEWNNHYQQPQAVSTIQSRPQTSMGFVDSETSRSDSVIPRNVARRASEDRRIHTATEDRNGPTAQMLKQISVHPFTSRESRSNHDSPKTNVLTL